MSRLQLAVVGAWALVAAGPERAGAGHRRRRPGGPEEERRQGQGPTVDGGGGEEIGFVLSPRSGRRDKAPDEIRGNQPGTIRFASSASPPRISSRALSRRPGR